MKNANAANSNVSLSLIGAAKQIKETVSTLHFFFQKAGSKYVIRSLLD